MTEQPNSSDEARDEGTRRRSARYPLLVAVLILLALLVSCTVVVSGRFKAGPQNAVFVVRNAKCLQCHTELLPEMRWASVHNPFARQNCLSCHNDHARLLKVTVASKGSTSQVTAGLWLRWGPFRRLLDRMQRAFFGVSAATLRTVERKAIGEATLVAPIDRLCWTCHGNLAAERGMTFQHQPFAANHCNVAPP